MIDGILGLPRLGIRVDDFFASALAGEASTSAAVANDTLTQSHMRLARGERNSKL
jgi:hypothetical protein